MLVGSALRFNPDVDNDGEIVDVCPGTWRGRAVCDWAEIIRSIAELLFGRARLESAAPGCVWPVFEGRRSNECTDFDEVNVVGCDVKCKLASDRVGCSDVSSARGTGFGGGGTASKPFRAEAE